MDFCCPKCAENSQTSSTSGQLQKKYTNLDGLELHLAVEHFDFTPYQCAECGARFCTEPKVLRHALDDGHTKFRYIVKSDEEKTREEINRLLRQAVGADQLEVKCPKCQIKFGNFPTLEAHLATEHQSPECIPFKCSHTECCANSFATETSVMHHEKEKHAAKRTQEGERCYSIRFCVLPQIREQRLRIRKLMQSALLNAVPQESPEKVAHHFLMGKILPVFRLQNVQTEAKENTVCMKEFERTHDIVKQYLFYMIDQVKVDGEFREVLSTVTGLGKYAATCHHQLEEKLLGDRRNLRIEVYREADRTFDGKVLTHGEPIICKIARDYPEPLDIVYLERVDEKRFCDDITFVTKTKMGLSFIVFGHSLHLKRKDGLEGGVTHWPLQLTNRFNHIEHEWPDEFGRLTGTHPGWVGYSGGGCFTSDGHLVGIYQGTVDRSRAILLGGAKVKVLIQMMIKGDIPFDRITQKQHPK